MTIPHQINTLFFDLYGTLTYLYPTSLYFMFTLLDERNFVFKTTAHRETLRYIFQYWANSEELAQDIDKFGKFSDDHWVHYLKRKLIAAGISAPEAADLAPELQPILIERYQPEKQILEDVKPTLKKLRSQGYTMGLVTNRSDPVNEELEEYGFIPYFDFYFAAGEIDVWKPDPGIFEHALYLAGSNPEETTYIGDNFYTDIVGARNANLYPILYDPRSTFPEADCQVIRKIGELCS
jgi:HAD superfamily hydrolase (TIGR01549 family)